MRHKTAIAAVDAAHLKLEANCLEGFGKILLVMPSGIQGLLNGVSVTCSGDCVLV